SWLLRRADPERSLICRSDDGGEAYPLPACCKDADRLRCPGETPAIGAKIRIGRRKPGTKVGSRAPSDRGELRDIQQFLRCAVGPRSVELELALEADDFGDRPREFRNGHVLPGSDVQKAGVGII